MIRLKKPEEILGDPLLKERKLITKFQNKEKDDFIVLKPSLDYCNFLKREISDPAPEIGENNHHYLKSKI